MPKKYNKMETKNTKETILDEISTSLLQPTKDTKNEFLLLVGYEKEKEIKKEIEVLIDGGVQYASFKDTGKMSPFNSFVYNGDTIHMIYVETLPVDDMILTKVIN